MNGAAAVDESSTSAPISRNMPMAGRSHHFLFCPRKPRIA
jgi:hypothetical protein